MGRGSPVCQQIREKIIEMFKNNVPQRKIGRDLDISPSTVHNIIKRFKESGGISVRKGQGRKPKLNNRDLRSLRRLCIKNRHSSISDITTWAQDYFGKPLSSTTIRSYIHKCQLNCNVPKGSPMLTVSRSAVDFSGLGGIWDGPSHSGNVYCGQMNQYFRYFLGGMDAVCSGPKKKRIIQTVTSNKSKSQGLSWYGVVSVPLAKVTCTSVMAPLMLKSTEILEHNMLPSRRHLFQGRPCIFQQDNAKPHSAHITKSWLRRKRVRVLDWPACSPDLSPIENVWRILKRKMRQRRPRTVAHLKTCLQEE